MSEEKLTLSLERGDRGLGFNIKGGTDAAYVIGDTGIFISKIKDEGAAGKDGRLKVGDKILEVNGKSLVNVEHSVAVETFLNAGETVMMTVIQNPSIPAKIEKIKHTLAKSGLPYRFIIPVALGVALVSAFVFVRSRST